MGGEDGGTADGGTAETDAGPGGGEVLELVAGDWTMGAGDEGYVCVRRTLERTVYIREFRPIAPRGTHHTVLTVNDRPGPDGVAPCSALTNGPDMIYGSGVGTRPLTLPEGVAIRVEAGDQVLLNLHLFNTAGEPITGRSGIEVVTLAPEDVEHEAQVVLAGAEGFSIPPRASDHPIEGTCTMTGDTTLFAVMPHMHTHGRFMEVVANGAGGPRTLHEDFYDFDEQRYTTFDPLMLASGDTVDVSCRFDNTTDSTVTWGDSTLQEMCYALLYRYPAVPNPGGITCTR